jgi:hypothetical protein
MTPTRHRVNPAVYAALDKLGPMPVPFFVPDVEGEWVMYNEADAVKPQGERMSRDMRALARELERTLPYTPGESAACARIDMIEQVLAATLPPPGHILDSEGKVHKQLGQCEGCHHLASTTDCVGVPLCIDCFNALDPDDCDCEKHAASRAAAVAATAGGEGCQHDWHPSPKAEYGFVCDRCGGTSRHV